MSTIDDMLRNTRVIAVLGAHHERHRAAFYVPDYLATQGYRIIPVNPTLDAKQLWGEPVRNTLAEIAEPVDMVDVFRRSELLPRHLGDMLAMQPRPNYVWLQLGVRNDRVAQQLVAAGIEVVQDLCTLAEHKGRNIGPVHS